MRPKKVLSTRVTYPEPLQVAQVEYDEASLAPVPPHLSQAIVLLIFSFLVVPFAISARVSFTFTLMSVPRLTRMPPPRDDENPPK